MKINKDDLKYCDLHDRGKCIYSEPRMCPFAYALANIPDGGKSVEKYCSFYRYTKRHELELRLEQELAYLEREIEKANHSGNSPLYWSLRVRKDEVLEELKEFE